MRKHYNREKDIEECLGLCGRTAATTAVWWVKEKGLKIISAFEGVHQNNK